VLVDGNRLPVLDVRPRPSSRGDALVPAISAASILAKVHRDRWCAELHAAVPDYGFAATRVTARPSIWQALARARRLPGAPQAALRRWRRWAEMTRAVAHISSRDNALLKDLRRLAQDHGLPQAGPVWLEGDHLCRAALARGLRPALALFSESNLAVAPLELRNALLKA
jgi:hypothetical protein